MPSDKPLIALRLEQPLYDRVLALARQDGRSATNFIAHHLRTSLTSRPVPRQVDIADAIADAVKRGPEKSSRRK